MPLARGKAFTYEAGYAGYFGVPFSLLDASLGSLFRSSFELALLSMLGLSVYVVAVQAIENSLKLKIPLAVLIFIAVTAILVAPAARYNLGWPNWVAASACRFIALAHMTAPAFN